MELIKRGIYYEDSYLGVTLGALVFPKGIIMIDAPLRPEDARSWRSMLMNQRGGTSRLMISLDSHLDRTLGAKALECTILSHQKTAQTYRSRPMIFKGQNIETGADWETYNEVIGTRWGSPDITFTDSLKLHWGGPPVILEHHPGPTPGSIWVIIPDEGVIFVGDLMLKEQTPFFAHADLPAWIQALKALQQNCAGYTILSGRGGIVTGEQVSRQASAFEKLNSRMLELSEQNSPAEATDDLIPELLVTFSIPARLREKFIQRLRYGLIQYYSRHFGTVKEIEMESYEEEPE
jgi:glyoxylase-like metal-dependent hydrolase (beta-lactamase superfamily II)